MSIARRAEPFIRCRLVVVRENTKISRGLEHEIVPGVVESLKIITEKASTRVSQFAFQHARANGRRRVTAIHKANIMKLSDGLFLESTRKVSREFTDITYDERIVDAACMQLVMRPEKFDVLLLPNLYGDIVSDLCAGLVGGLGVVPGANMGVDCAVFEAVHGSAPDIADQNLANPTALLLSGLMMLNHIGEGERAERIRAALERVLIAGVVRTLDLGGTASTTEFTDALCREVRNVIACGSDIGRPAADDIIRQFAREEFARYLRGGTVRPSSRRESASSHSKSADDAALSDVSARKPHDPIAKIERTTSSRDRHRSTCRAVSHLQPQKPSRTTGGAASRRHGIGRGIAAGRNLCGGTWGDHGTHRGVPFAGTPRILLTSSR